MQTDELSFKMMHEVQLSSRLGGGLPSSSRDADNLQSMLEEESNSANLRKVIVNDTKLRTRIN